MKHTSLSQRLTYIRQVAIDMTDYMNAATTNMLSPDILPVEDLGNMPRQIESKIPSVMHLPISLDNTLHFYQYLSTHVMIADRQFLLLIDMPYKTEHNSFKYMKFSVYQFHTVTCQLSRRLIINM